jgi:hypothetical protein
MPSDWSHEETDDPLHADRRNFYKGREVEQGWAVGGGIVVRREQPRQGQRIFERLITKQPRSRLTIRHEVGCCRSGLRHEVNHPSFRGVVPASGPQYHQRVGSEERLGMATTIAFSSVGVLSSTLAYWICNLEIRLQREPSIQIVRNCLSKQRFFAWPFRGVRRPTGKRF